MTKEDSRVTTIVEKFLKQGQESGDMEVAPSAKPEQEVTLQLDRVLFQPFLPPLKVSFEALAFGSLKSLQVKCFDMSALLSSRANEIK